VTPSRSLTASTRLIQFCWGRRCITGPIPALKNALDYCGFDEFEHKTVGLLAVAGGGFPITALEHLRSVCRALNCWVIPHQAAVPNARNHIADGQIVDADIEERVVTLGEEAVQYANIEPDPACFESAENVGADD